MSKSPSLVDLFSHQPVVERLIAALSDAQGYEPIEWSGLASRSSRRQRQKAPSHITGHPAVALAQTCQRARYSLGSLPLLALDIHDDHLQPVVSLFHTSLHRIRHLRLSAIFAAESSDHGADTTKRLANLLHHLPNLCSLSLPLGIREFSPDYFTPPGLDKLDRFECTTNNHVHMHMVAAAPNLRDVSITNMRRDWHVEEMTEQTTDKFRDLIERITITDGSHIERLTISGQPVLKAVGVRGANTSIPMLPKAFAPNVRHLSLVDEPVTPADLRTTMAKYHRIESVCIIRPYIQKQTRRQRLLPPPAVIPPEAKDLDPLLEVLSSADCMRRLIIFEHHHPVRRLLDDSRDKSLGDSYQYWLATEVMLQDGLEVSRTTRCFERSDDDDPTRWLADVQEAGDREARLEPQLARVRRRALTRDPVVSA